MWAAPVGPVAMAGPRVRARRLRDRVLMPAGVLIKMPRDRNDASVPGGPRNPEAQAERGTATPLPATGPRGTTHDARGPRRGAIGDSHVDRVIRPCGSTLKRKAVNRFRRSPARKTIARARTLIRGTDGPGTPVTVEPG